jgi:hypothetical protein
LSELEHRCVAPTQGRRPVGLAFSGGGSRSLSASMGQMRALHYLGVLERTSYISAVSGGAWATSLYTYLPARISDEDFLGDVVVDPGQLFWHQDDERPDPANLAYLPPGNLGRVPQRLAFEQNKMEVIRLWIKYWVPKSKLWVRLIGERIFEPYGLSTIDRYGNPAKSYSCTPSYVADHIVANNPGLSVDDFHLIEKERPTLIINASMFVDRAKGARLVPLESTPIGLGIRSAFPDQGIVNDNITGHPRRDFGGGLVQPFAFGSRDQAVEQGEVAQVSSSRMFSLADMAGLSSAAFAEKIDRSFLGLFGKLIPKYDYWPVTHVSSPKNTATDYLFADGGNLENTGINALLARGLPTVVSFVNSQAAIDTVRRPDGRKVIRVDGSLPPLFGFAPLNGDGHYQKYSETGIPAKYQVYRNNQVFRHEDFKPLLEALERAGQAGGPVVVVQPHLKVLPNRTFDVPGSAQQYVDMVWVYNEKPRHWWERLSSKLRSQLTEDWFSFRHFPHYRTVTELELSPVQVNLLAQLSSWVVLQDDYPVEYTDGRRRNRMTSRQLFKSLYR